MGWQHHDADDGRVVLRRSRVSLQQRRTIRAVSLRGIRILDVFGMLRALEGFVQHTGATNADVFWMATMSLANWTANVILPMFALTQLVAMALHMGGVVSEIYPGSTWIRKFVAAIAALMVSGIVRLAESMVTQAHGI